MNDTRETVVVKHNEGGAGAFFGHPFRVIVPSNSVGEGCSVIEISLGERLAFPELSLPSELGVYVQSGSLLLQAGCQSLTIPPGEFVHLAAETAVRMTGGEEGCELLLLAFPGGLDHFLLSAGGPPAPKQAATAAEVAVPFSIKCPPNSILFEATSVLAMPPTGEICAFSLGGCLYRSLVDLRHPGFFLFFVSVFPGGQLPAMSGPSDRFFYGVGGTIELKSPSPTAGGRRITVGDTALVAAGVPSGFAHGGGDEVAEFLVGGVSSDFAALLTRAGIPRSWDDQSAPGQDGESLAKILSQTDWKLCGA